MDLRLGILNQSSDSARYWGSLSNSVAVPGSVLPRKGLRTLRPLHS
jgi:hypothetical protein